MKILLIRHGETTGDLEDRYGGFYDDHLTERGRQQLTETAEKLKGVEVDIIFSSSLVRAQESAEIVNTVLNTHIEIQDGLRKWHCVWQQEPRLSGLKAVPRAV